MKKFITCFLLLGMNTFASEGVPLSKVNDQEKLQIQKAAKKIQGHFSFYSKGIVKKLTPANCAIGYKKKNAKHVLNQKPYRGETIFIHLSTGQELSKTIRFSNIDYKENFTPWDFRKSFGPMVLKNANQFGENSTSGSFQYFGKKSSPYLEMKHISFDSYQKGNERKKTIVKVFLDGDTLKKNRLIFTKIHIQVSISTENFWGEFTEDKLISDLTCSNLELR